jgi:hypothetical protein
VAGDVGFFAALRMTINGAFRLPGMEPAGDQRGCSPPLETPFNGAHSKLRGILDLGDFVEYDTVSSREKK